MTTVATHIPKITNIPPGPFTCMEQHKESITKGYLRVVVVKFVLD